MSETDELRAWCKSCGAELVANYMEGCWEHFAKGCEFSGKQHSEQDVRLPAWRGYADFAVGEKPETAEKEARRALAFLAAHDAAIREQAQREQYEADCAAMCKLCGKPNWQRVELAWPTYDHWCHRRADMAPRCDATHIRAAWAKAHPAKEKTEVKDGV